MTEHDDFRELFADATSDIRPLGSLDEILERTKKVDPMTRRWFLPAVAAAAVIGLAIGGAAWLSNDSNDRHGTGGPIGDPTPTESTTLVERAVPLYFVGDIDQGKRLFREFQKLQTCPSTDCLLRTAVTHSIAGDAEDRNYSSLWPDDIEVKATAFTDDLISIDLSSTSYERPSGMTAEDADLAIQQAIYTAEAAVGKGRLPVGFTINGNRTDKVLGVPASEPLAAGPELDTLAPVQISSPSDGATLPAGDLTVTGVAAAFEANVSWELMVPDDPTKGVWKVVDRGHAMTTECCKLEPYEFTIRNLQPGTYLVMVHDSDESGNGRPVNEDTKEIVVQ